MSQRLSPSDLARELAAAARDVADEAALPPTELDRIAADAARRMLAEPDGSGAAKRAAARLAFERLGRAATQRPAAFEAESAGNLPDALGICPLWPICGTAPPSQAPPPGDGLRAAAGVANQLVTVSAALITLTVTFVDRLRTPATATNVSPSVPDLLQLA